MKQVAHVYLLIAGFLCMYFFYKAVITPPYEGDSLAYHLPMAQNVLEGRITDFEREENRINSLLQYYPAASHHILALFLLFNVPQLFNFVGWVFLGLALYMLAKTVSLKSETAVIFTVSAVCLTSVIRLIPTQTIDTWLAAWFILSMTTLLTYKKNYQSALLLGFSLGMLIGTKYTGLPFASLLLIIFSRRLMPLLTVKHITGTVLVVLLLGGTWYIRNFITHGDFLYPSIHPAFHLDEANTMQAFVGQPSRVQYFIQSLVSEYSFWGLSFFTLPFIFFSKKSSLLLKQICVLGMLGLLTHLIIPASIENMLSDLRYSIPMFIISILAIFIYAERIKKTYELTLLSLVPVLSIFSLSVQHQPKVFFVYSCWVMFVLSVRKHIAKL